MCKEIFPWHWNCEHISVPYVGNSRPAVKVDPAARHFEKTQLKYITLLILTELSERVSQVAAEWDGKHQNLSCLPPHWRRNKRFIASQLFETRQFQNFPSFCLYKRVDCPNLSSVLFELLRWQLRQATASAVNLLYDLVCILGAY